MQRSRSSAMPHLGAVLCIVSIAAPESKHLSYPLIWLVLDSRRKCPICWETQAVFLLNGREYSPSSRRNMCLHIFPTLNFLPELTQSEKYHVQADVRSQSRSLRNFAPRRAGAA